MFQTLISPSELKMHLDANPRDIVVDTRFWLADPGRGRRDFTTGHIPGAVYTHLDEDLSGTVVPGKTGRHPLPDPDDFAHRLALWGIGNDSQVFVYDQADGGIAARLWWMLRWLGHDATAVLDGGWQAWLAAGFPTETAIRTRRPAKFILRLQPKMVVHTSEVMAMRSDSRFKIVDARTADRFAGQNETIDPIAGHIPGAANLPYIDTTDELGRAISPDELRSAFEKTIGHVQPENTAIYCGSGVTACRSILAMEHAGLPGARLYAGSWSEYINQSNAVATGNP